PAARDLVHARLPRVRGHLRRDAPRAHAGPRPRGAPREPLDAGRLARQRGGPRAPLPRVDRMAAVMWVEVLARNGEVLARVRMDSPEARVGRAFDNDVV